MEHERKKKAAKKGCELYGSNSGRDKMNRQKKKKVETHLHIGAKGTMEDLKSNAEGIF